MLDEESEESEVTVDLAFKLSIRQLNFVVYKLLQNTNSEFLKLILFDWHHRLTRATDFVDAKEQQALYKELAPIKALFEVLKEHVEKDCIEQAYGLMFDYIDFENIVTTISNGIKYLQNHLYLETTSKHKFVTLTIKACLSSTKQHLLNTQTVLKVKAKADELTIRYVENTKNIYLCSVFLKLLSVKKNIHTEQLKQAEEQIETELHFVDTKAFIKESLKEDPLCHEKVLDNLTYSINEVILETLNVAIKKTNSKLEKIDNELKKNKEQLDEIKKNYYKVGGRRKHLDIKLIDKDFSIKPYELPYVKMHQLAMFYSPDKKAKAQTKQINIEKEKLYELEVSVAIKKNINKRILKEQEICEKAIFDLVHVPDEDIKAFKIWLKILSEQFCERRDIDPLYSRLANTYKGLSTPLDVATFHSMIKNLSAFIVDSVPNFTSIDYKNYILSFYKKIGFEHNPYHYNIVSPEEIKSCVLRFCFLERNELSKKSLINIKKLSSITKDYRLYITDWLDEISQLEDEEQSKYLDKFYELTLKQHVHYSWLKIEQVVKLNPELYSEALRNKITLYIKLIGERNADFNILRKIDESELVEGAIISYLRIGGRRLYIDKELYQYIKLIDNLYLLKCAKKARIGYVKNIDQILPQAISQKILKTINKLPKDEVVGFLYDELWSGLKKLNKVEEDVTDIISTFYQKKVEIISDHEFIYGAIDHKDINFEDKVPKIKSLYDSFQHAGLKHLDYLINFYESIQSTLKLPKSNLVDGLEKINIGSQEIKQRLFDDLIELFGQSLLGIRDEMLSEYRGVVYHKVQLGTPFSTIIHEVFALSQKKSVFLDSNENLFKQIIDDNINHQDIELEKIYFEDLIHFIKKYRYQIDALWLEKNLKEWINELIKLINTGYSPKALFDKLNIDIFYNVTVDLKQLKEIVNSISNRIIHSRLLSSEIKDNIFSDKTFNEIKKIVSKINFDLIFDKDNQYVKKLSNDDYLIKRKSIIKYLATVSKDKLTQNQGALIFDNESLDLNIHHIDDIYLMDLYLYALKEGLAGHHCALYKKDGAKAYHFIVKKNALPCNKDSSDLAEVIGLTRVFVQQIIAYRHYLIEEFLKECLESQVDEYIRRIAKGFLAVFQKEFLRGRSKVIKLILEKYIQENLLFIIDNISTNTKPKQRYLKMAEFSCLDLDSVDMNVTEVEDRENVQVYTHAEVFFKKTEKHVGQSYITNAFVSSILNYDFYIGHMSEVFYSAHVLMLQVNPIIDWSSQDAIDALGEFNQEFYKNSFNNTLYITLYAASPDEEKIVFGEFFEYKNKLIIRTIDNYIQSTKHSLHAPISISEHDLYDMTALSPISQYISSVDMYLVELSKNYMLDMDNDYCQIINTLRYKHQVVKRFLTEEINATKKVSLGNNHSWYIILMFINDISFHIASLKKHFDVKVCVDIEHIAFQFVDSDGQASMLATDFINQVKHTYLLNDEKRTINHDSNFEEFYFPIQYEKCIGIKYGEHYLNSTDLYKSKKTFTKLCSNREKQINRPTSFSKDNFEQFSKILALNPRSLLEIHFDLLVAMTKCSPWLYFHLSENQHRLYRFLVHEQLTLNHLRSTKIYKDGYHLLYETALSKINLYYRHVLNWISYPELNVSYLSKFNRNKAPHILPLSSVDTEKSKSIYYLASNSTLSLLNKEKSLAFIEYFESKSNKTQGYDFNELVQDIQEIGCKLSLFSDLYERFPITNKFSDNIDSLPNNINELFSNLVSMSSYSLLNGFEKLSDELLIESIESGEELKNHIEGLSDVIFFTPQIKLGASIVRRYRSLFINILRDISSYMIQNDYYERGWLLHQMLGDVVYEMLANESMVRYSSQNKILFSNTELLNKYSRYIVDTHDDLYVSFTANAHPILNKFYQNYFNCFEQKSVLSTLTCSNIIPIQEILEAKVNAVISMVHNLIEQSTSIAFNYNSAFFIKVRHKAYKDINMLWKKDLHEKLRGIDNDVNDELLNQHLSAFVHNCRNKLIACILDSIYHVDSECKIGSFEQVSQMISEQVSLDLDNKLNAQKHFSIDCDSIDQCVTTLSHWDVGEADNKHSYIVSTYYHYKDFYADYYLTNYTIRRFHLINKNIGLPLGCEEFQALLNYLNSTVINFTQSVVFNHLIIPSVSNRSDQSFHLDMNGADILERTISSIYTVNCDLVNSGLIDQLILYNRVYDNDLVTTNVIPNHAYDSDAELLTLITIIYTLNEYRDHLVFSDGIQKLNDKVQRYYINFIKNYQESDCKDLSQSKHGKLISREIEAFIANENDNVIHLETSSIRAIFANLLYVALVKRKTTTISGHYVSQLVISFLTPISMYSTSTSMDTFLAFLGRVRMLIGFSYKSTQTDRVKLLNLMLGVINEYQVSFDKLIKAIDKLYFDKYTYLTDKLFYIHFDDFKNYQSQVLTKKITHLKAYLNKQIFSYDVPEFSQIVNYCQEIESLPELASVFESDHLDSELKYHNNDMQNTNVTSIFNTTLIHVLSSIIYRDIVLVASKHDTNCLALDKYSALFAHFYEINDEHFDVVSLNKILLLLNHEILIQIVLYPITISLLYEDICALKDESILNISLSKQRAYLDDVSFDQLIEAFNKRFNKEVTRNNDKAHKSAIIIFETNDGFSFRKYRNAILDITDTGYELNQLVINNETFDIGLLDDPQALYDYVKKLIQSEYQYLLTLFVSFIKSLIYREGVILDKQNIHQYITDFIGDISNKDPFAKLIETDDGKDNAESYKKREEEKQKEQRLHQAFDSVFAINLTLMNEDDINALINKLQAKRLENILMELTQAYFIVNPYRFLQRKAFLSSIKEYLLQAHSKLNEHIGYLYDVYIPGTELYESVGDDEETMHSIEIELQTSEEDFEKLECLLNDLNEIIDSLKKVQSETLLLGLSQYTYKCIEPPKDHLSYDLKMSFLGDVFRSLEDIPKNKCIEHHFYNATRDVFSIIESHTHNSFLIKNTKDMDLTCLNELAMIIVTRILINFPTMPTKKSTINIQSSHAKLCSIIWVAFEIFSEHLKFKPVSLIVNDAPFKAEDEYTDIEQLKQSFIKLVKEARIVYTVKVLKELFSLKVKISGSTSLNKIFDALKKKR